MLGGPDAEGWPLTPESVGEDVTDSLSVGTVVYFNEAIQRDMEIVMAEPVGQYRVSAVNVGESPGTAFKEAFMPDTRPGAWDRYKARQTAREEHYATPAQVAQRLLLVPNLCWRMNCTLSGGAYHVGPCEPCSCGLEHAVDECPENYGS